MRWLASGLVVVVVVAVLAVQFRSGNSDADTPIVEAAIGCDRSTPLVADGTTDAVALGPVLVDPPSTWSGLGDDGQVRFGATVLAAEDDARLAILQITGTAPLVAGVADLPAAASARRTSVLSFARCDEAATYPVVVAPSGPDCLVLVGSDPSAASFTELPVPVGGGECSGVSPRG